MIMIPHYLFELSYSFVKMLNIVFKLTLKVTSTSQCSSVSVILQPMSIIPDMRYSILYGSRFLNHDLRIQYKLEEENVN